MKMLRRSVCLLLCAALFLTLLAGCGKQEEPAEDFVVSAAVCGPLETLDLLLFHDMPRNALKKKLESIRAAVENLEFPEYPGLRITVSIGGAHAVGPLADTVQKADQALYHAKAAKNRTVLYKEDRQ